MEEFVLFPEWLFLFIDMGLSDLECHVFICDFRDVGEEKYSGEDEDKNPNREINPLHTLESIHVIGGGCKECIRAQHGADNGTDGVECLGEVDSDFRVLGRTTDYSAQYLGLLMTKFHSSFSLFLRDAIQTHQ